MWLILPAVLFLLGIGSVLVYAVWSYRRDAVAKWQREYGPPPWAQTFRERFPNAAMPNLETLKVPVLRGARVLSPSCNPRRIRRTRVDDALPHYAAYEEIPENLLRDPTFHRCGVYLFVGTVDEHVEAFRQDLLNQLRAVAKLDPATGHTSEEDVQELRRHWLVIDDAQRLPAYQYHGVYAIQNREVNAEPHAIRYDALHREQEATQVLTAEELRSLQTAARDWTPVPHPVVEPALRRLEFPPE